MVSKTSTPPYNAPSTTQGFTLAEMAIVLVIIAIAIGGALVGADMIRSAKIRAVANESETLSQALRTFKDRYKYNAGDFPNAENIWGQLNATLSTCITIAATQSSTATCNGNGDGSVGGIGAGTYTTTTGQLYEMFRAWQHLNNAELINGFYTGVAHSSAAVTAYESAPLRPAGSTAIFGINAPKSDYSSASGWNIGTTWGLYNSCNDSTGKNLRGNVLVFAGYTATEDFNIGMSDGVEGLLTPQETKTLDAKIDDGLPTNGKMQVIGLSCSVDCSEDTAYNVQNDIKTCGIVLVDQF
ncbi:MAG: prepilin-type N-terminal cleavage/methylation domain-containing protein [Alphaproteobacteria bacterium]|nr:prepilin-type N-terminal cleavage/methylation domain-containing protein [Alphaproteobacteria bacterium]